MVEMSATVRNRDGIHCRPAALIAQLGQSYMGRAIARTPEREANLRSVMEILALGLLPGEAVTIEVEGPDEQGICAEFVRLFESEFNFRPGDALTLGAARPRQRTHEPDAPAEAAPDSCAAPDTSDHDDGIIPRRRRRILGSDAPVPGS
jgi:phosphotransferase system HPr (HPr) family protein